MSKPLRLFLLENSEEVAFLISRQLVRAGHLVSTCRTAADALLVLGTDPFDLVLLDDSVADPPGIELLRNLHREGVRTPVIVMAAHGSDKLAAEALRAGAIDYLVKDQALTFLTELPKRVEDAVARHALQQSNQLLAAALESARDGICITDLQGTMLHVNVALETMTGYRRDELIGQNPRLLKSGVHDQKFYAQLWRTVLARRSWQGEMCNRRKDGTTIDVSLSVSPIIDGRGQLTHLVGILRDICERKQLEKQLIHAQKMQSVGTLAGGVAHEFNNLLAGIQGYANLGLREPKVPPQLKEFLQFIVDLSDRAANLTRQLLAFARKPALTRRPTDLAELLKTTAELIRRSLSIDVNLAITPDSSLHGEKKEIDPLTALADANQLQQVLINLALNARDALSTPAPIFLQATRVLLSDELPAFPDPVPAGDHVVLEVRDQGKGMSPEILQHALDPFFTTKDVGKGTGLGLSVAFGIVQGHQGRLTIQSEPGQGTCVRIYLPRLPPPCPSPGTVGGLERESPDAPRQIRDGVAGYAAEKLPGRSILVVDDEHTILDVIQRYLEIAGHRVSCVTSGAEALQLLSAGGQFDLVILDWMIPQEDSATVFKKLRQRWPRLPVLVCTGMFPSDSLTAAFHGESVRVLPKPFRMDELWQAVNQTLDLGQE